MSNPINRAAVGAALGIAPDHQSDSVFRALVANGFLPAPLDASYDSWDISAVNGVTGTAASIQAAARKIATSHRSGKPAQF